MLRDDRRIQLGVPPGFIFLIPVTIAYTMRKKLVLQRVRRRDPSMCTYVHR
jgi:hypothetical protein